MWAACFCWQHRTFGIHSTQRAEAIHSSIARFCSIRSSILAITKNLEQMAEQHNLKSEMNALNHLLESTIKSTTLLPMATKISDKLTRFGWKMTNAQAAQIARYRCELIDSDTVPECERQYRVTLIVMDDNENRNSYPLPTSSVLNTSDQTPPEFVKAFNEVDHGVISSLTSRNVKGHVASVSRCSCQYAQCWGLPCRHIFRVLMELNTDCWKTCLVRELYCSVLLFVFDVARHVNSCQRMQYSRRIRCW